ncbi:uncharacterized protein LOC118420373 [Branchiostoma floridae]|uniref:Uncharacterized protein LOC118420373 n=1 Tax=Branchiostoma floridae TaxID=7739 RepID=A0A9J7LHJ5_BRAFL|nr:uncharacterized protein LOC118420373 [Branchiostoma floridae]
MTEINATTLFIWLENLSCPVSGPVRVLKSDQGILLEQGRKTISAVYPEGALRIIEVCLEFQLDCHLRYCHCPANKGACLEISILTTPELAKSVRSRLDKAMELHKNARWVPTDDETTREVTDADDFEDLNSTCDDCGFQIFARLDDLDETHRNIRETLYRQCIACGDINALYM